MTSFECNHHSRHAYSQPKRHDNNAEQPTLTLFSLSLTVYKGTQTNE